MREAHADSCRASVLRRHLHLGETKALEYHVTAAAGQPARLLEVIRWLDVERSARYQPDSQTYCNIYALDYCYLNAVHLPRSRAFDSNHNGQGERHLASVDLAVWLERYGSHFGWQKVNGITELQSLANEGFCCLMLGMPTLPTRRGHVSIVAPETEERRAVRRDGIVLCPVQSSAGAKLVTLSNDYPWFATGMYSDVTFWSARLPTVSLRNSIASRDGSLSRVVERLLPELVDEVCARMIVICRESKQMGLLEECIERALVCGEDRRYYRHKGFDPKGIARALWMAVTRGRVQGASTIEQQLVRTLTRRRDPTITRKMTEILAAIWLSANFDKRDIMNVYLRVAYFGWRMLGVEQARRRLNLSEHVAKDGAADLVACLRYPRPKEPSFEYIQRHSRRSKYILKRMDDIEW